MTAESNLNNAAVGQEFLKLCYKHCDKNSGIPVLTLTDELQDKLWAEAEQQAGSTTDQPHNPEQPPQR